MGIARNSEGTAIYYEVHGAGSPLVLLNGQGNDHHLWHSVLRRYSTKHQVILLDYRGTGKSEKPRQAAFSTRDLAGDVISVMDSLGITRADIFGVSMGGRIAQWVAIDHPDRVRKLVLGCTSPSDARGVRRDEEVVRAFASGDWKRISQELFCDRRIFFRPRFWLGQYLSSRHRMDPAIRQAYADASSRHDALDQLAAIRCPVLLLHGSEDRVNPTANVHVMQERITHAEIRLVKHGRHVFFLEFDRETAEAVNGFLAT